MENSKESYTDSFITTIPSKKRGPRKKLLVLSKWLTLLRILIISNTNTNVKVEAKNSLSGKIEDKNNG